MFTEGFQGVEEAAKQSEQRKTAKFGAPRRMWLVAGEEKHVSFIDDTAVSFFEHSYELNGKWGNYEHCIGQHNGCPFCLGQSFVYRVTVFTVIDHSTWTDKKGQTYVDQKKILAAKEDQALLLRDLSQMCNGLKGKRVVIRRSQAKNSAAWGTSFSLAMQNGQPMKTDWSRYDRNILVPFDYRTLFAPKSVQELSAIYQSVQMGSSTGRGIPLSQGGGFQQRGAPQHFAPAPQYPSYPPQNLHNTHSYPQQTLQNAPNYPQQAPMPPMEQGVPLPVGQGFEAPVVNPLEADIPF